MATTPYFVISPNAILSIIGLLRGPDRIVPTPDEDWRTATVDVVIPAFNEEKNITLCLSSLARQTLKPKRIILIDDGSEDRTLELARDFCAVNGMELTAIRRQKSIGKTPTIKRQAREFDSDVEFILDGDTVLESDNYLERTVEELYKAVGIACACGTILPLREKDRRQEIKGGPVQNFLASKPNLELKIEESLFARVQRTISNLYRDTLYLFLQKFVYHGQMVFFGSITNPVGCAVAYRRKYIIDLFEKYEPILGDDLTNSEDIFIGFALLEKGYRNIQLMDVCARSEEPEVRRLPRQIYMWSSSFLQSCYYFDSILRSPFKSIKRYRHYKEIEAAEDIQEKRKIKEPYRQPFGEEYTRTYGRPMGWVVLVSAFEKISFPTVITLMLIMRLWEPLAITLVAETILCLSILAIISKGHRWAYVGKGLLVTPVRYLSILFDLLTMLRFAFELWVLRDRSWRK
ncbi:MAG: glycosyltransferase family 2 protein [Desulfobulbaceae bacterium]|nr:glycosyltransferase family 2 protein [Desulfobulbaceae bacterium]